MKQLSKILILIIAFIMVSSMGVSAKDNTKTDTLGFNGHLQNATASYSEKTKTQTLTWTINLDDLAQAYAQTFDLSYQLTADLYCGTSRTFERKIEIKCYDKDDNELPAGDYSMHRENYIASAKTYSYDTGDVTVPIGTDKIEVYINNHVSTSQTMKINAEFSLKSLRDNNAYIDINSDAKEHATFTMKENADAGTGEDLYFYNIFADSDTTVTLDSPQVLYKHFIVNRNYLYYWAQAAYQIIKDSKAYTNNYGGTDFEKSFGAKDGVKGFYHDMVTDFLYSSNNDLDDQHAYSSSSGLRYATDIGTVWTQFTDELSRISHKIQDNDYGTFSGDTLREQHANPITAAKGPIYYTYLTNIDIGKYDNNFNEYYNGFLLVFYDFKMNAVNDNETYEIESQEIDKPDVHTTLTRNDTDANSSVNVAQSWSYSDSFTNTLSNSQTTTSSMTHGWSGTIGGKWIWSPKAADGGSGGGIDLSFSVSGNYSISDAFTFSESKSTSTSKTQTSTSGINTPLAPYTIGELNAIVYDTSGSLDYECPINVSYKVAIVSLYGNYGVNHEDKFMGEDTAKTTSWIFGDNTVDVPIDENNDGVTDKTEQVVHGDAVKELRDRYMHESEGDGDTINWNNMKNASAAASLTNIKDESTNTETGLLNGKALFDGLATHYPIAYAEATATYTETTTLYDVQVYPSRPLYRTAVTNIENILHTNDMISTTPGSTYDISANITVGGFNKEGKAYHGFAMTGGSWHLEYMVPYTDPETNLPTTKVPDNVARIFTNASSGKTFLYIDEEYTKNNASNSKNPILLIFSITDAGYKHYGATDDETVHNDDLASKASLTVVVNDKNKTITPAEITFTDVEKDTYYHDAVGYLNHLGFMIGISNNRFDTDSNLTRGQLATILYRVAQEEFEGTHKFTDVENGSYYEEAIAWAYNKGIIKGITQTLCAPNQPVTREQFVTILYRYAQYKGYATDEHNNLTTFKDAFRISNYAEDAMKWAVEKGIINGIASDTLAPQNSATRAQAATMVYRYCTNVIN